MQSPTPNQDGRISQRLADFRTVAEGLDYAALSPCGMNFYSLRGELVETLSYRNLRDQAMQLARRLLSANLGNGARVGIVAETDSDFLRLFFACQYARLVPVPLPLPAAFGGRAAYTAHLESMLRSCEAAAIFAPEPLLSMAEEASANQPVTLCGTIAAIEALPEYSGALPEIDAEDLSYIQFSSGSTRFPLGIAVTHRALLSNCGAISRFGLKVNSADRCTSWLPFFHDMGLIGFVMTPMLTQISVDYVATRDFARRPMLWLQLLSANGGTLSYSPSFGYELCARRAATTKPTGLDLSKWRAAGIGGDMVRAGVLNRFADAFSSIGFRREVFVASYGLAEATLALSFAPLDRGLEIDSIDVERLESEGLATAHGSINGASRFREFALCGPILPGHAIEIRGTDGMPLGERRAGQIFVRGPSLMKEYFRSPADTARVMSPDGWLDTGDIGYRFGESLVITGRRKDLILVKGRNLFPQDLEWTIEQEVDGVRSGDVAAFSVDDGEEERVVLLIESRLRESAAKHALEQSVRGIIRQRAGLDCEVVILRPHSLPHTSSGKLSRSRARDLYLHGRTRKADAGSSSASHTRIAAAIETS